ncbi:hypothetical protein HOE22_10875 [Candidatus Woesearchaeota archaeon]|jgi:ribosomal protein L44E|nr:hypothetical protein [Candidatus Woesearchaeota archaeon]MBT4732574.1 hypothetical protein [Candidatus Woesearchaeota archaeon]MBT7558766.1 hypothetical protein [Candidatus Woesearchaeota archaeon]
MPGEKGQGINPYLGKPIPKEKIVRAIQESESMIKAAASLHTSYNTFKKYAKLYDVFKPHPNSRGISRARKVTWSGLKPLDVELTLQKKLIRKFILPQRCSQCGESRFRKTDMLSPLILHFIDGDIHNKVPDNMRFFCYNCYFLEKDHNHKRVNVKIGRTFEDQNGIEQNIQDDITGDELAKELGASLADLFGKT